MEDIYGEKGVASYLPDELVIPAIDDNRLKELYAKLKPIVTIDEIKYLLKKFTLDQVKNRSYICNIEEEKGNIVDPSKLEPIEDFLCLHTWGYYGFFKPSIKEVLAQAPELTIKEANAFEMIEFPETGADIFRYPEVLNAGFHLSKVRSYKINK